MTLSTPRIAFLLTAPLFLVGIAYVALPYGIRQVVIPTPTTAPTPPPMDGAMVYAAHCAYCHGPNGDGRGAVVLTPPARYYGRDKFKFGSTLVNEGRESIPSDSDLMAILDRGIPGSSMPSFAGLPAEQKAAVIGHVRGLIRKGLVDRQIAKAMKNEDDVELDKFALAALKASAVGEALTVPKIPASTPAAVLRGRKVYEKLCMSCHGPEGKGDGPQVKDLKNDDGTPNVPRDLTKGIYKVSGDSGALYARIMLGIPGTPMPASNTQPQDEIFDLIAYVQSLAKK